MKIHRVILRDKDRKLIKEIRYCNGILYTQNRSNGVEISFTNFLNQLEVIKDRAKNLGLILICDVVNENELWQK